MASLNLSSIFLVIVCAILIALSFILNFSLWITLIKLRRLRHTDKSNYFLTHLITADFIFTFFIIIPTGYGLYNDDTLDTSWCHVQTYFQTLSFLITFHGLFWLSIERYWKFSKPNSHIKYFSTEAQPSSRPACLRTSYILTVIWCVDIFLSFIPLFKNFNDLKYFLTQSQCDYIYENFAWWLYLYFFGFITVPFIVSIILFTLTLRLIGKYTSQIRLNKRNNVIEMNSDYYDTIDDYKQRTFNKIHTNASTVYSVLNKNPSNWFNTKKTILTQFKYKTDVRKTKTYLIITILSYLFILPLYIIHIYRTSNNIFDNNSLLDWKLYTSFAWIAYLVLILKSFLCFTTNSFYRDAFYQAAGIRGFRGKLLYEHNKNHRNVVLNNQYNNDNFVESES